jgi:hypothetical protein
MSWDELDLENDEVADDEVSSVKLADDADDEPVNVLFRAASGALRDDESCSILAGAPADDVECDGDDLGAGDDDGVGDEAGDDNANDDASTIEARDDAPERMTSMSTSPQAVGGIGITLSPEEYRRQVQHLADQSERRSATRCKRTRSGRGLSNWATS